MLIASYYNDFFEIGTSEQKVIATSGR